MPQKKKSKKKKKKKNIHQDEEIRNVPNFLSILRIVLTFVIVYMILVNVEIVFIILIFGIAAFTDFLDGQIARRFNCVTEFGRKTDMIADRILWMGTALAFLFAFGIREQLTHLMAIQLLLIMSREIITLPFAIIALMSGKEIPQARYIGKFTTMVQGFALPSLILSVFYPAFTYISLPLAIIIGITGPTSAMRYLSDVQKLTKK